MVSGEVSFLEPEGVDWAPARSAATSSASAFCTRDGGGVRSVGQRSKKTLAAKDSCWR